MSIEIQTARAQLFAYIETCDISVRRSATDALGGLLLSVTTDPSAILAEAIGRGYLLDGDTEHFDRWLNRAGETIANRVALQQAYAPFAPEIEDIRSETTTPEPLGEGHFSVTYPLETSPDGRSYVVKLPAWYLSLQQAPPKFLTRVDSYARGLSLGKGLSGMEQIVAIDYADEAAVSVRGKGKPTEALSAAVRAGITEEQITDAVDNLEAATDRWIELDEHDDIRGDVLYDPMEAFTFLDYGRARLGILKDELREHNLAAFAAVLYWAGYGPHSVELRRESAGEREQRAHVLNFLEAEVTRRYRQSRHRFVTLYTNLVNNRAMRAHTA